MNQLALQEARHFVESLDKHYSANFLTVSIAFNIFEDHGPAPKVKLLYGTNWKTLSSIKSIPFVTFLDQSLKYKPGDLRIITPDTPNFIMIQDKQFTTLLKHDTPKYVDSIYRTPDNLPVFVVVRKRIRPKPTPPPFVPNDDDTEPE